MPGWESYASNLFYSTKTNLFQNGVLRFFVADGNGQVSIMTIWIRRCNGVDSILKIPILSETIAVLIAKIAASTSAFPILSKTVAVLIAKPEALTSAFPILSTTIAVLNRRIAVLSLSDRETFQSDRAFPTFN